MNFRKWIYKALSNKIILIPFWNVSEMKKTTEKWQMSVKQFQSRQVILPGLFLYILLSHDKITHMDR